MAQIITGLNRKAKKPSFMRIKETFLSSSWLIRGDDDLLANYIFCLKMLSWIMS